MRACPVHVEGGTAGAGEGHLEVADEIGCLDHVEVEFEPVDRVGDDGQDEVVVVLQGGAAGNGFISRFGDVLGLADAVDGEVEVDDEAVVGFEGVGCGPVEVGVRRGRAAGSPEHGAVAVDEPPAVAGVSSDADGDRIVAGGGDQDGEGCAAGGRADVDLFPGCEVEVAVGELCVVERGAREPRAAEVRAGEQRTLQIGGLEVRTRTDQVALDEHPTRRQ